jgi:uncharacterized protein YjiS (DUF1127 family)
MVCGPTVPVSINPAPFGRASVRLDPEIGVFAMFTPITYRPLLRIVLIAAGLSPNKAFASDDPIRRRPRLNGLIAGLASTIRQWVARSRQRRALREIAESNDHHLLKDIGVSQEEAFREADKPFWQR